MSSQEDLESPPKKEPFQILTKKVEEISGMLYAAFEYVYSYIYYTTDNNATTYPRPIVYHIKITTGMDADNIKTIYEFDFSDTDVSRIIAELIKWKDLLLEGINYDDAD
jgi:hypothetical protein